jgi:hypothetical protein
MFYDGRGNTYDIFGNQEVHGAPQSREYLFEGVDISSMTGNEQIITPIDPIETIDPELLETDEPEPVTFIENIPVENIPAMPPLTSTESVGTGKKFPPLEKYLFT